MATVHVSRNCHHEGRLKRVMRHGGNRHRGDDDDNDDHDLR